MIRRSCFHLTFYQKRSLFVSVNVSLIKVQLTHFVKGFTSKINPLTYIYTIIDTKSIFAYIYDNMHLNPPKMVKFPPKISERQSQWLNI